MIHEWQDCTDYLIGYRNEEWWKTLSLSMFWLYLFWLWYTIERLRNTNITLEVYILWLKIELGFMLPHQLGRNKITTIMVEDYILTDNEED